MAEMNNILPVISFYDLHAAEYNSHMSALDNKVRLAARQYLVDSVSGGNVLDFGGGTGLDLLWLSEHYGKVFFLEPSANMRAEALKIAQSCTNVSFVKEINFHNWDINNMPFSEKVNGVMANFAVFNCISDINLLFEKLALISTADSYMIVTVLNTRLKNLFKNHPLKLLMKAALNRQIEIPNNKKGISHITYLHTIKRYMSAAKGHFDLLNCKPVPGSNFMILIFKKK